jgi:2Fe-2S ferredoxin
VNAPSRVVSFVPIDKKAVARPDETLLDVARRAGVPLGSSCGGVGICARCKVRVLDGAKTLSKPTSVELTTIMERRFAPGERLACQAVVGGDCTVTTTYW